MKELRQKVKKEVSKTCPKKNSRLNFKEQQFKIHSPPNDFVE